jgi:membrane protease YdiL (CAAX protease family)
MTKSKSTYFQLSQTIFYSLLIAFPLVFTYEIIGTIVNWQSYFEIRNSADFLIRDFFQFFGEYAHFAYGITLFIIISSIAFVNRKSLSEGKVRIDYLFLMIFEGIFWGIILFIFLSKSLILLLSSPTGTVLIEHIYLSIGAGIYEELIFRLLIFSGLITILTKVLRLPRTFSIITSLFISSIVFSLFHYLGSNADSFELYSFLSRALGGVFLGLVYYFRGLGITIYAHIFYDLIVVIL